MLDAVMYDSSEEYRKYIDIDSWAKFYLFQEFSKNYDVLCGSLLMRRDGLAETDKLIAGPVWDLDNSFGRTVFNDAINVTAIAQFSPDGWYINSITGVTSFLQYLGQHKDFMQRVYEVFNENEESFYGVLTNLDSQAALICKSAAMNYSLYDINQSENNVTCVMSPSILGTKKYAYTQIATVNYQDYLANLRNFISKRLEYLSDNIPSALKALKPQL